MPVEKMNPITIAVVEDDIDLLANTLDYLKSDGFDAWGCTSAESFYKQFAVQAAHIVVLDIGLPNAQLKTGCNCLIRLNYWLHVCHHTQF